ncbi:MAG: hypothetical protein KDD51_16355, partial [Bdellovibrionales bacterium]|nr:hypothetical protein [Bdellovibrionales bacterium]
MPKSLFLSLLVVFFGFVAVESFGEDKIQVQLHLPGETEPRHLEVTIGGVETDRVVLDLSDQNRIAISPTDSDSQIPLRSIEVRGEVAAQILSKIGTDPRAAWLFPGLSADASPRPYRLYGAGLSLSSISASGEAKAKADSMELLASPIRMDQNAILRITKQPSLA